MRLLVTLQYEYDVEPEHYPGCSTPAEIAALDVEVAPWVICAEEHKLVVTAEEVKS